LSYSRDIERGEGAEEGWKVEGDARTLRTAETFELSRRQPHARVGDPEQDILHLLAEQCAPDAFFAKTQGEPYHVAMLAVAMLFETRFPGAAIATGDLDEASAGKAAEWVDSVLGTKLMPPVLLDSDRIRERLEGLVQSDELEDTVDRLWRRPVGNEGFIADVLGILRGASPMRKAGLDSDGLIELWTTGDETTFSQEQRLGFELFVVGLQKVSRILEDARRGPSGRDAKLVLLARAAARREVCLTDEAWSRLERLGEGPALDFAFALIAADCNEMTKSLLQRAVLENPRLFDMCVALFISDDLEARVQARLR